MCRYTGLLKTVATMEYTANSVDDANKIIAVANIVRRLGQYDVALELLRQSLVIIGTCPHRCCGCKVFFSVVFYLCEM